MRPTVQLTVDSSLGVKFAQVSDAYTHLAGRLEETAGSIKGIAEAITVGVQDLYKTYGRFEMVMDITSSIASIMQYFDKDSDTNLIYVLPALWGVYRLIKLMLQSLPESILVALGLKQEEEFFDVLVSEVNDTMTSLTYATLMQLLPKPVRNILDTFAKFSRIRLLDDLSWLGQIAVAVLSVPAFILHIMCDGFRLININGKLDSIISMLVAGEAGYMKCINFLPTMRLNAVQAEMADMISRTEKTRRLLHEDAHLVVMEELSHRAQVIMGEIGEIQTVVPELFRQQKVKLDGLIRASKVLVGTARVEPIAILFYAPPGVGKTYFVQRLMQAIKQTPDNTIYTYRKVNESHDFNDFYGNQTGWFEDDVAQSGPKGWAQYIYHISNAKSPLDAAVAERKQTLFFNSRFIMATTNKAIHVPGTLRAEKDCGWEDPEAVMRRWMVVDMSRYDRTDTVVCPVLRFNLASHRYEHYVNLRMDCQTVINFMDDEMKAKARTYKTMLRSIDEAHYDVPNFNLIAEVRDMGVDKSHKNIQLNTSANVTFVEDIPVVVVQDDIKCVKIQGTVESVSRLFLEQGYMINGGDNVSLQLPIVASSSKQAWEDYCKAQHVSVIDSIVERLKSFWKNFRDTWSQAVELVVEYKEFQWLGAMLGICGAVIAGMVVRSYLKSSPDIVTKIIDQQSYPVRRKQSASKLFAEGVIDMDWHNDPNDTLANIRKNILYAEVVSGSRRAGSIITVVDHQHIVAPLHTVVNHIDDVEEDVFIKGFDGQGRVKIETYYRIIDYNVRDDWAILCRKNPAVPVFGSIHRSFVKDPTSTELFIVSPYGVIPIGQPRRTDVIGVYHKFKMGVAVLPDTTIRYSPHEKGLCGSLIVTKCGYVFGWHVASSGTTGLGYARPWESKVRSFINGLPITEPSVREDNFHPDIKGVIPIRVGGYVQVSSKSTIEPSTMQPYNLQSIELTDVNGQLYRAPAKLSGPADETGIDVYTKARQKNLKVTQGVIDQTRMRKVKEYVKYLVKKVMKGKKITVLNEYEIVKGTEGEHRVKGVNKKASAGIPFGGLVGDCVTDHGTIRDDVRKLMAEIEIKARKGIKGLDVMFKDCGKDELRPQEKVLKPRIFAAGPVHFTLLIRKYFARLSSAFMAMRHETGVMIGINPTSEEWQKLYHRLRILKNVFDGDYSEWDGGMLKEFQEVLNEVLSEESEEPEVAAVLLSFLSETIRVGKDFSYLTTHSVPSGHGLTSLYNSLINKMYQFYAWLELVGDPLGVSVVTLITLFEKQVYGPVYGDDVVLAVDDVISDKFNAISYSRVMRDLGLGFTNAKKQIPLVPFVPLSEISFLKRVFYFHPEIQQVVGPLDLTVLKTTLSWTHDITRDDEIAVAKMDSVQRELFLHPRLVYVKVWNVLKSNYGLAYPTDPPELAEEHMVKMYWEGEYNTLELFED